MNVFNSFGCTMYTSYDVNVYPNPKVVITPIPQFILHNNGTIKLSATPAGGTFKGEGVTGTSFNPSNIGLGKKTIYYNYSTMQGCSGSAKLQTIVVDSIGTKCTSYDTVTITSNASGPAPTVSLSGTGVQPGVFTFDPQSYSPGEGGTATVTVTRTGGSDGAVSVDFAATAGTPPATFSALAALWKRPYAVLGRRRSGS